MMKKNTFLNYSTGKLNTVRAKALPLGVLQPSGHRRTPNGRYYKFVILQIGGHVRERTSRLKKTKA
jgi:hypothetical protein